MRIRTSVCALIRISVCHGPCFRVNCHSPSQTENAPKKHAAWPSGFPYQCVPYSRRADFILRSRQFRNKISPACKLKLQCNWLIHAYIMTIVAGAIQICRGSAPGSFISVRSLVHFVHSLFLAHFFFFLWITFFIKFFGKASVWEVALYG